MRTVICLINTERSVKSQTEVPFHSPAEPIGIVWRLHVQLWWNIHIHTQSCLHVIFVAAWRALCCCHEATRKRRLSCCWSLPLTWPCDPVLRCRVTRLFAAPQMRPTVCKIIPSHALHPSINWGIDTECNLSASMAGHWISYWTMHRIIILQN